MVVVEYTYEEMKGLVNLPREKMIEMLGEMGAPSEYEPETKKIISELTPNRPDWYSMEGLARALRAYWKKERPEYTVKKSDYKVVVDSSVAKVRPYTVCAVVKGLQFNDQRVRDMVLLQEKLLATLGRRVKKFGLGIYPLKAICFPIKYTTMKPEEIAYVPLGHEKKMAAKEILKEHKKGQEYGHLIQDYERYPVFVDARGKLMALIPVVNSAETGRVDESTKAVFIEVTGNDMNSCKAALNIIVCTFADMGGIVYGVKMEYGKTSFAAPDLAPSVMKLDLGKVNTVLGLKLKEREAATLLAKMGYDYKKGRVLVPPYRADVLGLVDIIEDMAVAYGYNNFEPTIPNFFSPGETTKKYESLDVVMRGMGFLEIKTFILTNKEKIGETGHRGDVIEITNPRTTEYTVVRPNLLADVLGVFRTNKMKGLPQKFYEVGIVHGSEGVGKRMVFGVMDKKLGFSDVRGYLQTLAASVGLRFSLSKRKEGLFDEETSCVVVSDEKEIGVFGKVKKESLEKFGLGFDVYLCELRV
jgi:phenylalanyl-tRNA synthetase beta chain